MNTDIKKKAKDDFEKDFFMLMNNSIFGKSNGKCEKTYRHQTCNNRTVFHIKSVDNRNEKDSYIYK